MYIYIYIYTHIIIYIYMSRFSMFLTVLPTGMHSPINTIFFTDPYLDPRKFENRKISEYLQGSSEVHI